MLTLKDFWYIAARSRELGQKPIPRLIEGAPIVLFRDSASNVQALLDRCAHRGMALSHGQVIGDCLECPYHGWQYDGTGTVRAVPALCAGEPLPRPKTMCAFPAVESDEHVWVWLGKGPPAEPPFRFPRCGEPGWATFFMHTRFEAPVEACLENFLDVPHTLLVHPGLFRGKDPRPTRARICRHDDSVEAEFLDERPMQGLGPRLLFPRDTVMRHTDRFILPSITRVDYTFGDSYAFHITSQCTQQEEYVVDVTTAITWRLPLPGWLLRPLLKVYCRQVIRQDVEILKVLGKQLREFGQAYTNTAADLLGTHIRGLRRKAAMEPDAPNGETEKVTEVVLRI